MSLNTDGVVMGMRVGLYTSPVLFALGGLVVLWLATRFLTGPGVRAFVQPLRIAGVVVAVLLVANVIAEREQRVDVLKAGIRFIKKCTRTCQGDACLKVCRCATVGIAEAFGKANASTIAPGEIAGLPAETIMRAGSWTTLHYKDGKPRPDVQDWLSRLALACAASVQPAR